MLASMYEPLGSNHSTTKGVAGRGGFFLGRMVSQETENGLYYIGIIPTDNMGK